MILVIGSKALNYWIPGFRQTPGDTDLVMTYETFETWIQQEKRSKDVKSYYPISGNKYVVFYKGERPTEVELAWPGSTAEMLMEMHRGVTPALNGWVVPNTNVLFTIKDSHKYKKNDPHFKKTLRDWHLLRNMGCEVPEKLKEFRKLRHKEYDPAKRPRLKEMKKGDFFKGDGVTYIYDHDSIHRAVAHLDKPAYEYYQKPGEEVECSVDLFDALPKYIRLFGVLEESYVLALERSQIPHKGKISPRASFDMALMKVCTSITGGWFRKFAYEHYFDVWQLYDDKYADKFWDAVERGEVIKL